MKLANSQDGAPIVFCKQEMDTSSADGKNRASCTKEGTRPKITMEFSPVRCKLHQSQ